MPCEQSSEKLIDFAYGELPSGQAAAIEAHLAECDSCRRQCEEIAHNIELLDRAAGEPMPATASDPWRIFAAVRLREAARSRRWRRAAISAAAAAVLIAVAAAGFRHVEVHATHVVIRWSEAPAPTGPRPQPPAGAPDDANLAQFREDLAQTRTLLAEHGRRLEDLDRFASLVVAELKEDDVRLTRAATALRVRIDALQRQNDERWQAVGRGFHDWYLTHLSGPSADSQANFTPPTAGDRP